MVMENSSPRTFLVVLGMHRSGTSVLSGTLGLLGVTLPTDLLDATPFNTKGHFESKSIWTINEEMLRELGSAWYDLRGIDPAIFGSSAVEKTKAALKDTIQDHYGDASLLVLKDPRFCRSFPALRSVIDHHYDAVPRVIFCFRSPFEVARSLNRRDGISLQHGLGLWLRHMLDGELHSRGLQRVFVDYADFLRDWRASIERVEEGLEVTFPRKEEATQEIEHFVEADLRHFSHELKEQPGSADWFRSTYQAFRKLVRDSNDEEALRELDLIRADFEDASGVFAEGFLEYYAAKQRADGEIEKVKTECEELGAQLRGASSQLENTKQQLQKIRRSRSWRLTAPLRSFAVSMRRLAERFRDRPSA